MAATTLPRKIRSPKDIATFFTHLLETEDVGFHPDENFNTYGHSTPVPEGLPDSIRVHLPTDWIPMYTPKQAAVRNKLMQDSFAVAEESGMDIYCIAIWASYFSYGYVGVEKPDSCAREGLLFSQNIPGPFDWWPGS